MADHNSRDGRARPRSSSGSITVEHGSVKVEIPKRTWTESLKPEKKDAKLLALCVCCVYPCYGYYAAKEQLKLTDDGYSRAMDYCVSCSSILCSCIPGLNCFCNCYRRRRLREKLNLEGSDSEDCRIAYCLAFCCSGMFAVMQELEELKTITPIQYQARRRRAQEREDALKAHAPANMSVQR